MQHLLGISDVRRWTAFAGLVLAAALLTGCGTRARVQNPAAAAPPPPAVIVTPAIARTVPLYEQAVAQTIALQTVTCRAQIAGTLQEVAFKEGTAVRKGQTLFVIDQRPYVAALQSAQAQLATARANLTQAQDQVALRQAKAQLAGLQATLANAEVQVKRDRYLVAQKAIAQQQLDSDDAARKAAAANVEAQEAVVKDTALSTQTGIEQAHASVQQAEAKVRQAQLNVEYTTVRAPVDGTISLLSVDAGNLVAVNQQLATLATVNPIVAQFPVSEVTFLRLSTRARSDTLAPGTSAAPRSDGTTLRDPLASPAFQMILSDGTTYPYPGTFRAVNNAVNAQSATILAQALFPNPQGLLRPGMYTRVRVKTEDRPNTVLIPQTAVQEVQGTRTVFVLDSNNTAVLRTITDGGPFGPFFIVLSGVQAGDRVIVEGGQRVRPGSAVSPTVRPAPAVP